MTEEQDNNEREALLKKIEGCPSKRVREAMLDSLNKENNSPDKDGESKSGL